MNDSRWLFWIGDIVIKLVRDMTPQLMHNTSLVNASLVQHTHCTNIIKLIKTQIFAFHFSINQINVLHSSSDFRLNMKRYLLAHWPPKWGAVLQYLRGNTYCNRGVPGCGINRAYAVNLSNATPYQTSVSGNQTIGSPRPAVAAAC